MPTPDSADRDLLFGIFALQMNFISREAFVAAVNAWALDKTKPLGILLVERGDLAPTHHALLDPLVDAHIARHGGAPEQSLAALSSVTPVEESLATIAEPVVRASLASLQARPRVGSLGSSDASASVAPASGGSTPSGMRFRVLRPHARGGLGEVFVARDEELGRTVALKEIQYRHLDRPDLRARFVVEAEINGNLEHPGIVPVYGLGAYPDGRPFYAMRFIQGDSLKDAIERFHREAPGPSASDRGLRLRQLLGRFVDICDAIAYAHSRGVLHRDLKPANVMLGRFGETLVVDWGLAKAMGPTGASTEPGSSPTECAFVPRSGESDGATLAGHALGTPGYMSPEQAEGRLDRLDARTDVYSLGATLYCLLAGRPPVSGEHALGRVIRGEFPSPRSVNKEVPRALEAVCLKAMALSPDDRYPSAQALADEVQRWLADEPVSARPDPLFTRAWRWARKHRTLTTTAAALTLCGALGLAVAYRREARYAAELTRANDQVRREQRALIAANRSILLANQESDRWLAESFQAIEDYYTDVGESVLRERPDLADLRRRLLEKPQAFYQRLASEYAAAGLDDDKGRARLARGRLDLGRVLHILGRNDEAIDQFRSAIALFVELARRQPDATDHRTQLGIAHNNLGKALIDTGRTAEAEAAHRSAIAAFEERVQRSPDLSDERDRLASAYLNLGNVLSDVGRLAEAEAFFRKSVGTAEAVIAQRPDVLRYRDGLASAYVNLGKALGATGRPADAEASLKKAVALLEALVEGRPDFNDYRNHLAFAYNNLAAHLKEAGRPGEAEATYAKAVEVAKDLVRREPDVPSHRDALTRAYNDLGVLLKSTGRPRDAESMYARSIAVVEELIQRQPDVPVHRAALAAAYDNLGSTLMSEGRLADAEAAQAKSVAAREALVAALPDITEYRNGLGVGLVNQGVLLNATGRSGDALQAYEKATAAFDWLVAREPDVPEHRHHLATAYNNRATVFHATARPREAEAAFRRSIDALEALVARQPDTPDFRNALSRGYANLASTLSESDQAAEAEAACAKSVALSEGLTKALPEVSGYRLTLANGYNNLARALKKQNRLAEAQDAFRKASGAFEGLLAKEPRNPTYLGNLGVTIGNEGLVLAQRGRHREAVERFRKAIEITRPLVEQLPQVTEYRLFLDDHQQNLASSLRDLGDAAGAAAAVRDKAKRSAGNPNGLYDSACGFALCVPVATDPAEAHSLALEAMATLRAAVAAGYTDGVWMSRDTDLAPLHDYTEFQKLVLDLMDRALPADPFQR